jgi:zinc transporter ZupT
MDQIVVTLSAMTFGLGLVGGAVAFQLARLGQMWLRYGLGFGSGFMLTIALVDMLKEASEFTHLAYLTAVLGFGFFYITEQIFETHFCPVSEHNCPEHGSSRKILGLATLLGMSLHSLIDGLAIGTALLTSLKLTLLVSIAVFVHKIPDGFCLSALLLFKKYKKSVIWRYLSFFALMTPLGAIVTYYGFKTGFPVNPGLALGFTTGSFIYIATTHMLPEAHSALHSGEKRSSYVMVSVLSGIALALLALFLE